MTTPSAVGRESELLSATNTELFNHVRLMAIARNPVLSWEDIAERVGLDEGAVPELLAWFIAFRLPPAARVLPREGTAPRDPELRAELLRLRRREESLVTVVAEAPRQLVTVQGRIQGLQGRGGLHGVAYRNAGS